MNLFSYSSASFVSVVLCASLPAVAADPRVFTNTMIQYTDNTASHTASNIGTDYTSTTVDLPGVFATAQAHAAYGALDVSGYSLNAANATANASATFEDQLYFAIFAEHPFGGSPPLFGASFTVSGNVRGIASASGALGPPLEFSGPGTYEFGGSLAVFPVSISVSLLGSTFPLPPCCGGVGPFSGSLRWNGITGIALPLSSERPRFTVTSASGFNYALPATPVPEPGTVTLILAGLIAMAWCRSRPSAFVA